MKDSLPPLESSSETLNTDPLQFFDDDGVALPPGTYARRDRRTRPQFSSRRTWWLITAAAAVAALLTGLLAGRFLIQ